MDVTLKCDVFFGSNHTKIYSKLLAQLPKGLHRFWKIHQKTLTGTSPLCFQHKVILFDIRVEPDRYVFVFVKPSSKPMTTFNSVPSRYGRDYQSMAGPGDRDLPMSEIQGYQPQSRIGEVVMNAFIDAYEFSSLPEALNNNEMTDSAGDTTIVEYKPMFHEWATVQPGMICLARKKKTATFRQYVAAETAVPVIGCAACLPRAMEKDFFFAGVARSKSVRNADDGIGPSVDEFFTLSIGGMATLLNNSNTQIHPGDLIEWCLLARARGDDKPIKRAKSGPRRVGVKPASVSSSKIIGRALSFAKSGEPFDILIKQ